MNKSAFEDLIVWMRSRELRIEFTAVTKSFPKDEKYLLVNQIVRAARSVTNNIAEGYGRFHYQENFLFCRQARGSLYELIIHLIICFDEKYITEQKYSELKFNIYNIIKLLNGYISYLKKQKELI